MNNKYNEFLDAFLKLEDELNLFSLQVRDVFIWERIRHKVFRTILQATGVFGQAHTNTRYQESPVKKYPRFVYRWTKSMFIKNLYFANQNDYLFLGSARRKKSDDGYWWDIYCDPITQTIDEDYIHIEKRTQGTHRKPARTGNLKYLDFINDTGIAIKKLGIVNVTFSHSEKNKLQDISGEFQSVFDVSINFEDIVKNYLSDRKSKKWMYDRFLKRVDPKIAVIVAAPYRKNFIESCKDKNIPVVELQHGSIHNKSVKHNFPEDAKLYTYPDYLLLFGDFWKKSVNYPISNDKIYTVGHPYLEKKQTKYNGISKKDQIVFVSQGSIGQTLSKFAAKFADKNEKYNIVYELHPGEYDRWRKDYPWLNKAPVQVEDDKETSLYKIFSESMIQVGVYSTAVYEGLVFGLDTYLLDAPGITTMQKLVEHSSVSIVCSVKDLRTGIEDDQPIINQDFFFEPNAIQNISEVLEEIIEGE